MKLGGRLIASLLTAVVAACAAPGDPREPSVPGASGQPPAALEDLRYACGRHAFTPQRLLEPRVAERENHPSAIALREFLARPELDIDWLPDAGWILAGRDAASADYLSPSDRAAGEGPPLVSVNLEASEGEWRVTGWGDCRPELSLGPDLGVATFRVEHALDPRTTAITALVTEQACASGRPADGRIVGPAIVYTAEQVLVAFAVRGLGGAQACPSNPATRVEVTLREPLGARALLDAAFFPPIDPTQAE